MSRRFPLPGATNAVAFMALGVGVLPLLAVGVVLGAPLIASGNVRAYPIVALNHLATLAWGVMVSMGAVYQLFPAMIGAHNRPGRGLKAQLGVTAAGIAALVIGFLARWPALVAVGGTAAMLGILWFVSTVAGLARTARRWSAPSAGVVCACGYLAGTVVWGWLMSANLVHRFWPGLLGYPGVGVHAALGVGGWFIQLIVSVSYYLLPRFTRTAPDDPRQARAVLVFLNVGVLVLAAAALTANAAAARLGAVAAGAAASLYAWDLWHLLKGAPKRKPDLTLRHWWLILGQTVVATAAGIAWAAGLLPAPGPRLAAAVTILVLLGWMTLAIMGQLYKVAPFLTWHYRLAQRLAPEEISRLPAPYYPAAGAAPMILTAIGSLGVAAAALGGHRILASAAAFCYLMGCLGFWWLMAASWMRGALRGTRRPPHAQESG